MQGEQKRPTIRDLLDKLNALLTEALAGTARIVGEEPPSSKTAEAKEPIMDAIHRELERALDKANLLTAQVSRIEQQP